MLSKEFKWTPKEIDNLTIQQLSHYLEEIDIYRGKIPTEDVTLEILRVALFQFAGVKGQGRKAPGKEDLTKIKASGFPVTKMTKKQMDKWAKAGYPELKKFLRRKK